MYEDNPLVKATQYLIILVYWVVTFCAFYYTEYLIDTRGYDVIDVGRVCVNLLFVWFLFCVSAYFYVGKLLTVQLEDVRSKIKR